jgi:hypothetical protein
MIILQLFAGGIKRSFYLEIGGSLHSCVCFPSSALVSAELQQKISFMASMGDVPYVSGDVMTICSWHFASFLKGPFV